MLKEKTRVKITAIDFNSRKGWKLYHNEDLYGNTEIIDDRFWNDVQEGYYSFSKGTTLIADIECPWKIEEPLKNLKVHEVIYSD
ncbi:MAG: hypothetical protein KH846_09620 [Leptotrichia wadei]|uniref:hypothetical protein n=1 Tax=Leptotrichia wadei TaxID=157687 RepID=UPI0026EA23BF|nr:hypothetical protein [Leptotrichia wadei]MBS6020429.1 hypothetical protein [Leptotrichia wadei]